MLEAIPQIQIVGTHVVTNASRIDFAIRWGQKLAQLEVKYSISSKATPLARLAKQMTDMVNYGKGQAIVWSLTQPTAAALTRLYQQVGPEVYNKVQFVNGISGLYRYLTQFFLA